MINVDTVNQKSKMLFTDLEFARNELKLSKEQAKQIKNQGQFILNQTITKINESFEEAVQRIKKNNSSLIQLEKEKIFLEVV